MIFFVVLSLAALSVAESDNPAQQIHVQEEQQPQLHPQEQQVAEHVNVIPVYKPIYKPYSVEAHYSLPPTFINWLNYYLQKTKNHHHRPHYNVKPYPDIYQDTFKDALLEYISGYVPVVDVSQYLKYIRRYPYVNTYSKSPALEKSWIETDDDETDLENIEVFGKKLNLDDNIAFKKDDIEVEGNVPYSKRQISKIDRSGHPIIFKTSYQVPHWYLRSIDSEKIQAPLETSFRNIYPAETMRRFSRKDNTILIKNGNLDLENSYYLVPKAQVELARTQYPGAKQVYTTTFEKQVPRDKYPILF